MIFNIVIGTSVFFFCLGEPRHSEVSFKNYHNIQYAPLLMTPIDEIDSKFNIKTTKSETEVQPKTDDLTEIELTTKKINIEPRFHEQYNVNRNKNGRATSSQHFGGYNIAMVYKSELRPETEDKYGYFYKNAPINTRSNIFQSYSNNLMSKQRQIVTPIPSISPDIAVYVPQGPLKHIMQGLLTLENAKIEPVLNPYYVKVPRVHLNIAHGHPIAHVQKKALENGNLKRIHLNKHKHKFVPDIDVLLERKSFLYPRKSLKTHQ